LRVSEGGARGEEPPAQFREGPRHVVGTVSTTELRKVNQWARFALASREKLVLENEMFPQPSGQRDPARGDRKPSLSSDWSPCTRACLGTQQQCPNRMQHDWPQTSEDCAARAIGAEIQPSDSPRRRAVARILARSRSAFDDISAATIPLLRRKSNYP